MEDMTNTGNVKMACPCRDCNNNQKWSNPVQVRNHLIRRGFKQDYTRWIWHGESLETGIDTGTGSRNQEDHNSGSDVQGDGNDDMVVDECGNLDQMLRDLEDDFGPKQPGNDIDVYLAPLIEDLQKLWLPGVQMFDAYSKETFTLRAMIFCTINDFPAYDNLSGYSVKGEKACPICQDDTDDMWLTNCSKTVYMGHRRFLPTNHAHRKRKKEFNGKTENNKARYPLTGKEVYSRVKDIKVDLGKFKKKRGRKKGAPKSCWKKRSIFWDLPYWEHLEV
ncbi:uncharacterized protein LOC144566640 [Carex rostrata]